MVTSIDVSNSYAGSSVRIVGKFLSYELFGMGQCTTMDNYDFGREHKFKYIKTTLTLDNNITDAIQSRILCENGISQSTDIYELFRVKKVRILLDLLRRVEKI